MRFVLKILNGVRYLVCLPMILGLFMITLSITLLFKWEGIIVLAVANHEGCSLSEAKRLLREDSMYKVQWGNSLDNDDLNAMALRKSASDQFTHPMYSYMSTNINSSYYRGKSFGE